MRLNPLAARCALALLPAVPTVAALAATVLLFAAFLAAAHAPA
ncbi:ABC transporter permease, partial [Burkholderia sp. Cy-647]|nr:ABC transporter permease [Burkholderia sp. Cy-647]